MMCVRELLRIAGTGDKGLFFAILNGENVETLMQAGLLHLAQPARLPVLPGYSCWRKGLPAWGSLVSSLTGWFAGLKMGLAGWRFGWRGCMKRDNGTSSSMETWTALCRGNHER